MCPIIICLTQTEIFFYYVFFQNVIVVLFTFTSVINFKLIFWISDEAYVKVPSEKRLGILRMISEHGFQRSL